MFCSTFNLPFGVLVMRNSFMMVPNELEEAAYCDGATRYSRPCAGSCPSVLPGVATTMLYAFLFDEMAALLDHSGSSVLVVSSSKPTDPSSVALTTP